MVMQYNVFAFIPTSSPLRNRGTFVRTVIEKLHKTVVLTV